MGLYVRNNEQKSKLQEKVASDLREKMHSKSKLDNDTPDGLDDSGYIEGTKQTTSFAWIWIALIAFFVIIAILAIILGVNK